MSGHNIAEQLRQSLDQYTDVNTGVPITISFDFRGAANDADLELEQVPLFIADRAYELEYAVARWTAVEATNNDLTIGISKVASGTAISGTHTAMTSAGWDVTTGANTASTLTPNTDGSEDLAVGDSLILKHSDNGGTTELQGLFGTIRLRAI
jgi:hypothetical protein